MTKLDNIALEIVSSDSDENTYGSCIDISFIVYITQKGSVVLLYELKQVKQTTQMSMIANELLSWSK